MRRSQPACSCLAHLGLDEAREVLGEPGAACQGVLCQAVAVHTLHVRLRHEQCKRGSKSTIWTPAQYAYGMLPLQPPGQYDISIVVAW